MLNEIKKGNLYEIADSIIEEIKRRKNPFDKMTLIFHSAKIAQWFKAYFLKKENTVLMNVEYKTLSSFINEIINPRNEGHVLTAVEYREYIIKALLSDLPSESYYNNGNDVNGINLYEFADKLSAVVFNMEFDDEKIGNKVESEWQKRIYEKANDFAEKDKCYTPKQMYLQNQNCLHDNEGKVYILNNSFISTLYRDILSACTSHGTDIYIFSLEDKEVGTEQDGVELYAAPSKMREIERLHSDICQKISENSSLFVNDFVVYAPDINKYAGVVRRVFQRSAPGYPEVPFRILGESAEKHDMKNALDILYKVANKGFFTRYDLSKMIEIPMFMNVHEIDHDDIRAFLTAVDETNTHRNGDWENFKKRLLSSMVADGRITLRDGDCLPYHSMEMNSTRIGRLIDIIEVFSAWSALFADGNISNRLSEVQISDACSVLDRLFSYENQYGEEKNYFYAEVKQKAKRIQEIFKDIGIPALTFLLLLKDAPNFYTAEPADVFFGGVTFLSLAIDNIVPGKHVYAVGMSSDCFPRIEKKNEIDFSDRHEYTYELDKKAFQNLMASTEKVTISFVYCDLRTEEEFFPSVVIPEKTRDQYSNRKETYRIPLDEKRPLNELYTCRELLSKKRIVNIGLQNRAPIDLKAEETQGVLHITTNRIKKYLENTIVYKYTQTVKDSEEDDTKSDEYEDIDLVQLKKYAVVKEIISTAVTPQKDGSYSAWETIRDDLLEKMKLEKKLPDLLEAEYLDSCYENSAKGVIEEIKTGYQKMEYFTLEMPGWILEMNCDCYCKEEGTTLSFIEPREPGDNTKSEKYALLPYVCALAFVAKQANDTEYSIILKLKEEKTFSLNSSIAARVLNEVAAQMQDLAHVKYMDIDLYSEILSDGNKVPKRMSDLVDDQFQYHAGWEYFQDKNMLNPKTDFGYDAAKESIADEVTAEYEKIKRVILYGCGKEAKK